MKILADLLEGASGAALVSVLQTDSQMRYVASLDCAGSPFSIDETYNDLSARDSSLAQTVHVDAFDQINLHEL